MSLRPTDSCRPCRLRKVSHLIRQGSGSWDEAVVHRYFYPWDVDEILKMKLPSVDMSDCVDWHYEKSGLFSVKSAYRLALMTWAQVVVVQFRMVAEWFEKNCGTFLFPRRSKFSYGERQTMSWPQMQIGIIDM
jgi:hypothetical protein